MGFLVNIQGLSSRLVLISNDTRLDTETASKFPRDHKYLRAKLEVKG